MIWLESKPIIEKAKPDLTRQAQAFKEAHGRAPRLAVILVGHDERSKKFIALKQAFARKVGVETKLFHYEAGISGNDLRSHLKDIVHSPANDAVIIQLPIPDIDPKTILDAVILSKDVDGLSTEAIGDFVEGKALFLPPVAEAVEMLLTHYRIALAGKRVTIVGRGRLVGRPVALRLLQLGVFPCLTDRDDPFLEERLKNADIVIAGAGEGSRFITGAMLKEGVVVIDVAGDADLDSVASKAAFVTPRIDGVGPLTVMLLIRNTIQAAVAQRR
jgi:methylenetetrahydrofolate dehydrogenase (NADP+)/methenyltetrahydrofolate cyclohydrolase